MDWSNLKGKALDVPKKNPLNYKLLEYRIMFIVRKEFEEFIEFIQIKNNKMGRWEVI
jgi:hypothetical protein